jgi:hypothetical protein
MRHILQKTKPIFIRESYKGSDKLKGKVAIITGENQLALHLATCTALHHPLLLLLKNTLWLGFWVDGKTVRQS